MLAHSFKHIEYRIIDFCKHIFHCLCKCDAFVDGGCWVRLCLHGLHLCSYLPFTHEPDFKLEFSHVKSKSCKISSALLRRLSYV